LFLAFRAARRPILGRWLAWGGRWPMELA